jgi:Rha family phage regulatory protein
MATESIPISIVQVKESPQDLISVDFLDESTPVVSSRDVAHHFQKEHKHILDGIKLIQSMAPESFTGPNFRPSEYTDATGRSLPCFQLTRDGFSLLAMGFTGAAALRWKLKYIEAFNALEAAVLENARQAALAEGAKAAFRLNPARRRRLRRAVAYRKKGLSVRDIAKLLGVHGRNMLQRYIFATSAK